MSPLTPMKIIGAGSNRGVRLFFLSCLHKTVSPTLILIAAVCLLLSAYLSIFSFCSPSRLRTAVSSGCSGHLLGSGSLPRSSRPNISLFGLAPVVGCTVALYALIPLRTSSRSGLPCNVAIHAVFFNSLHTPLYIAVGFWPSGVTFGCLNPSSRAYASNAWQLNGGPLSDFTSSGTP